MILISSIILAIALVGTPVILLLNAYKENKEIKHAKLQQPKPNTATITKEVVTY